MAICSPRRPRSWRSSSHSAVGMKRRVRDMRHDTGPADGVKTGLMRNGAGNAEQRTNGRLDRQRAGIEVEEQPKVQSNLPSFPPFPSFPSFPLPAVLIQLIETNQHVAGFAAIRWTQNPGVVQLVDDACGPSIADPEPSLQGVTWSPPGSGCTPLRPRGTVYPDPLRSCPDCPPPRPPGRAPPQECPPPERPPLAPRSGDPPGASRSISSALPSRRWRYMPPGAASAHSCREAGTACLHFPAASRHRSGPGWCGYPPLTLPERQSGWGSSP